MSTYDVHFRRYSPSQPWNESYVCFGWQSFENLCNRVHVRASKAGHARLMQASHLYPETDSLVLYHLDAAAWRLVISEVDAMLADVDLHSWQKEHRTKDFFIQCCLRDGLDPDDFLRQDRQSAEAGLRLLRERLAALVEQGAEPSPRNPSCYLSPVSSIYFRTYATELDKPAWARFYGKPFEAICRRLTERAAIHEKVNLAEAAQYAMIDGYLAAHELAADERRIILEEVDAILTDAQFFAYEQEQNAQPSFIEGCQRYGQTPDEFQQQVREETKEQLRLLRDGLMQLRPAGAA